MSVIPYMLHGLETPYHALEKDFFGCSPFNQVMPRGFFGSSSHPMVYRPWENLIKPLEQLSSAMNQLALNEVGKITLDDEKFQVNLDVQHFAPEEINVKVIDRYVVVEGKHEEKKDLHGFVSRQFVRRYVLPEGCLPDTVESKLSADGVLTVTAPKILAMPSIGEKIVPIKPTGPIRKKLVSPEASVEKKEKK